MHQKRTKQLQTMKTTANNNTLINPCNKFNWKRMSGHLLTSYPFRYGRGTAAYFIPEAFQSLLTKIGFGATLSAY